jgi:DNA-binding beta-propeller fold protein YncE
VFGVIPSADQVFVINTDVPDPAHPETIGLTTTLDVPGRPRAVVFSPDGSRAFVALSRAGAIAVIDPLSLRQVDLNPLTPTMDNIPLGAGTAPMYLAIDPQGSILDPDCQRSIRPPRSGRQCQRHKAVRCRSQSLDCAAFRRHFAVRVYPCG